MLIMQLHMFRDDGGRTRYFSTHCGSITWCHRGKFDGRINMEGVATVIVITNAASHSLVDSGEWSSTAASTHGGCAGILFVKRLLWSCVAAIKRRTWSDRRRVWWSMPGHIDILETVFHVLNGIQDLI